MVVLVLCPGHKERSTYFVVFYVFCSPAALSWEETYSNFRSRQSSSLLEMELAHRRVGVLQHQHLYFVLQ